MTVFLDPETTYKEITVRLNGKGVIERRRVLGAEIAADRRYVARHGQFIISRIDARNGASGLVPVFLDGAVVTNDFPLFDVVSERLDAGFLGWLAKSASFVELCGRASEGTTNRVRLSEERFRSLTIPLPSLQEQRALVARISDLAVKISESIELRIASAEETEALSRSAIDSVYYRLAREVGLRPIGEVCTCITDGDHQTPTFVEDGVKFIFVGNVSTGRLHFGGIKHVTVEYFDALSKTRVPRPGDILYSAVGATLGIPAVVNVDEKFCFQRHVAILKPNREIAAPRFLWHMLRSRTVFEKAWASTTGSAQPTIPLRAIRQLPVPIPSVTKQTEIADELDQLQANLDALRARQIEVSNEMSALLPAVLDRAFKGLL